MCTESIDGDIIAIWTFGFNTSQSESFMIELN